MASKRHDFIVSAVARKIRMEGFKISYFDGRYETLDTIKPRIPPKIIRHKPDIIGEKENGAYCVGEAKTEGDIFSERTKNQIIDFMKIVELNPENMLIIGIPLNTIGFLTKILIKLGFHNNKQIEILRIPEKLLPYEEKL